MSKGQNDLIGTILLGAGGVGVASGFIPALLLVVLGVAALAV